MALFGRKTPHTPAGPPATPLATLQAKVDAMYGAFGVSPGILFVRAAVRGESVIGLLAEGKPMATGQIRGNALFGIVERHARVATDPSEWWTAWWIDDRRCEKSQGWPSIGMRERGDMAFHFPNMGKLNAEGLPRDFRVIQVRTPEPEARDFMTVFDRVDAELRARHSG